MLRADVGDIMICMPEVDLDAARGQKKADPANHGEVEPSIGFFSVVSPSSTLHTLFGFFPFHQLGITVFLFRRSMTGTALIPFLVLPLPPSDSSHHGERVRPVVPPPEFLLY